MKIVFLAGAAALLALTAPAQAAVTYTFSSVPNPGVAATAFTLTTSQYITTTTTFGASAFSSCTIGGGAMPVACSTVQFVPSGTPFDSNSYIQLNTAANPKIVQLMVTNAFANNGSKAPFGSLPDEGFSQFTITGFADAPTVPEPATWGMLIVGLGMAGGAMRYRRSSTAALA